MNNELTAKIKDMDQTAFSRGIRKASGFLSLSEQAEIFACEKEFRHPRRFFDGGREDAERKMLIWPAEYEEAETGGSFGSEKNEAGNTAGETGTYKSLVEELIALVKAEPVNAKFADTLTHRDFLGALMNLGIERDRIGDILVKDDAAYIYCVKGMAPLICDELTRVKHTDVKASVIPLSECDIRPELKEMKVNVASERLDAILSAVFRLPRSKAAEAVESERVFVDGRTVTGCGSRLKEGARISVRGLGKFIYDGIENESRKGRLFVKIRLYI